MHFHRPYSVFLAIGLTGVFATASAGACRAESPAQGNAPQAQAAAKSHEPMAATLSLVKAANFLDAVTLDWIREHKCLSCHTGYPYLLARASIGDPDAPAARRIRTYLEDRVAEWDRGGKGAGYLKGSGSVRATEGITEVVAVAATLAVHDARTTGKLHPRTRQALARTWELQRPAGAWAWNHTRLAPMEHDDYFGAVYAAVGVGHAPGGYADSAEAQDGVRRLREYLRQHPAPDLHHKTWLLWASVNLPGLMTPAERARTIQELLALQRDDGGWSLSSLGNWKRRDGKPNDKGAAGDGYGTGLVVYVLRQAGIAATAEPVRRGVEWLKAHQRVSGRWFTPSLNHDGKHVVSNVGTAFAIMALRACDVPVE
jgi:squalene-hopene/tetraprenyl-beta-curcumene cyclase